MSTEPRAIRKPLGSGQRLLFRTKKAYELARDWLTDDRKVQAYSQGFNSYSDKGEWPHYIYVTRKASGHSLDNSDVLYLDSIVFRIGAAKTDLVEEETEEFEGPFADEEDEEKLITGEAEVDQETEADVTEDETEDSPALSVAAVNQEIQRLELGLQTRFGALDSRIHELLTQISQVIPSLDERLDTVTKSVDARIEGLRSQEIRAAAEQAAQGNQTAADQLLQEAQQQLDKQQIRIDELQFSMETLRAENASLQAQLADNETVLSELKDDMQNQSAQQRDGGWRSHDLQLARHLSETKCSDLFWKHLRDRLGTDVPTERLTDAIGRIRDGKAKGKPLCRDGHQTFYEYKCNLGEGSGSGRLYFDPDDGFCLLGFGGKDHQQADIDLIFQTRRG